MTWVATAIAGSAVLGGVASYAGGRAQANAANHATDVSAQQYQQTRSDLMPWQNAGNMALSQINQGLQPGGQFSHQFGLQDFQASPAYNFNLEQGKLALDKASAARGKYYAPSTLQDIAKFSQGLASNEYQNAFSNYNTGINNIYSRLYGISGQGASAANQTGQYGTQVAGQIGQNITGAANAQAAGMVGVANAATGGVGNYLNYDLTQQILARNQGSSVGNNSLVGQGVG
jgi:hypothetical protein